MRHGFRKIEPAKSQLRLDSLSSRQPVILRVSADPVLSKTVRFKLAYRAVVNTDANRPFAAFDFFEVERRVQRILAPEPVGLLR